MALNFLLLLSFAFFSPACGLRASDPGADRGTAFSEPKILAYEELIEAPEYKLIRDESLPGQNSLAKPKGIYHKLRRGQTLYSLSRSYQVPLDELMRANRISDPTKISSGSVIFIPKPSGSPGPRATVIRSLSWPLHGRVTGKFGPRGRRSRHEGIDIDGEYGAEVKAAAGGTITEARTRGNYGRMVLIHHGDGLFTLYAHLSKLLVRVGDRVERGDPIAKVGRSGNARGTHLHFEVHRNRRPVDPLPYLGARTKVNASSR